MKTEILNVIVIENGAVLDITSFENTPENVEKAETLFKNRLREINEEEGVDMDEDALEDALDDGFYESMSRHMSLNLTWSTIETEVAQ